MKILILGFSKIKYMPYSNIYINNLNSNKNIIDFVYWNRDLIDEDIKIDNINLHEFRCYQEDEVSKISKVRNFLKYRNFVKKIIKNNEFDFIIALHTMPAMLLIDVLLRKYHKNFIFDYRDYTYESNKIFKFLIHLAINKSYATFVSSDGYRKYLPNNDFSQIITTHNLSLDFVDISKEIRQEKTIPIKISFWGLIRDIELNKEIIIKLANDERFELNYYGRMQNNGIELQNFVNINNVHNVFFHGEYTPGMRNDFSKTTDLIHNIYDNNNAMMSMANKYYDGLIFGIPQLCMEGSYMAELIEKNGIGLVCNPYKENFSECIWKYYKDIDNEIFNKNRMECLNIIMKEYDEVVKLIRSL